MTTARSLRPKGGLIATVVGISLSVASVSIVSAAAALPATVSAARDAAWTSQTGGTASAARNSSSWAGYVVSARSPFTSVGAHWTVAAVNCPASTSTRAAVQWVGFDGWYDRTVEQGGTEAYCSGTTPVYSAWWEMYPTNRIKQMFSVRPGDAIAASVTYANRVFKIVVHDVSAGKVFTIAQPCGTTVACSRSTAEWVVEAPSYGGQSASLARWNQVSFTHTVASISGNPTATSGIAAFTSLQVTMTDANGSRGRRAQPGALAAGGQGFTEAWISAR